MNGILGSWYRASSINIKQTNTMQLGSDLYYCTSWLLYMFRAPLAPIIRSTTTVYAASGTSHTSDNREFKFYYCTSWLLYMFRAPLAPIIRSTTTVYAASGTSHTSDNRLPTWPSLNLSSNFITALLDYSTCFGRLLQTRPRRKAVIRAVTCARGCIYSCCAPDDGCKRRPKHVE